MKQRSFLPVVVITAVVALVLGSIGTAVAGPALTKGKVKAIATKVVKKQAPTLSVAHAATAGSRRHRRERHQPQRPAVNGLPEPVHHLRCCRRRLPLPLVSTR